ncbi:MAG: amidohydrolase [Firmicutes bacterium]|nr:amidohydrolase [Bacillota bacterium]
MLVFCHKDSGTIFLEPKREVTGVRAVVLRGGSVVDGTGNNPPYEADVAICDGIITAVEPHIAGGDCTVDVTGLLISPGFIDIHSHADCSFFRNPLSDSKLMQGVTTEVVGNCGIGLFPVSPGREELFERYVVLHETSLPPSGITWRDFSQYAETLTKYGMGVNFAVLAAHGSLRLAAMGMDDRQPDEGELQRIKVLLEEALKQGAWGMSLGLIYPPGSFADTDELIALAGVVEKYQGVVAAHIRNEGNGLREAMEECIRIGKTSGVRMQVSHLKAIGKANWGRGDEALAVLVKARREGVDICADQYPYEATSTSLTAIVPQWALEGGPEVFLQRLSQSQTRETIKSEIIRQMALRGGPERIMLTVVGTSGESTLSGKTVAQIADSWACSAEEAVARILLRGRAVVSAVFFSLAEGDVAVIAADKMVAVGSDGFGLSVNVDGKLATHPRSYGTFPRFLAQYVRKKPVLNWQEAIYKMTGLPASRMGFTDRGVVKPGMAADITVFSPDEIIDKSGYVDCHNYSYGIEYVFVNGTAGVWQGKLTGNRPGLVLKRR